MHRQRILLVASLAAFIGSIVVMSPRSIATTQSTSNVTATYDAVRDFSTTSNPNGSWSYGWEATLGGAFTPYAVVNSTFTQGLDYWVGPENCGAPFFPLVAFNHTGSILDYSSGVSQPANMLSLHPSCTGKFSVVRWTAPTTGWFNAVGLFQGIDTRNTTTDVHIRQNSTTALLDENINGLGNQAPFNFTRYLAAGETLDFVVGVGSNGNYGADSTGLAVTITDGTSGSGSGGCSNGFVPIQNGTATFSSNRFEITSPDQAVDGNFNSSNGWHIARVDAFDGTTSETAVWETTTDVSPGPLVFKMHFLHDNPGHLLGRFRFSITTDNRSTFADGLDTGGDVDANWFVLTNPTVIGPAGMIFTTLPDNSVLAGGTTAPQGVYTVSYSTTVSGITGIRLEALEDPSLPGGNGPGLFPRNGNFFLTELQLYATTPTVFNIADGDVAGLIAAINSANANECPTTINLAPKGTYILTSVVEGSEWPSGLPIVRTPITINGNGSTIQRSSAPNTPLLIPLVVSWTPDDPSKHPNLILDGVTLTGSAGPIGGLALSHSTALVRNSTITNNSGSGDNGGGIHSYCSNLTILNSTISYNTNESGFGGAGVAQVQFNGCNGSTSISFSTIFENRNNGWGRGDAIATRDSGPGSFLVKNSILASPTRGAGSACWSGPGVLVSLGHNIAGDATCGLSGAGDMNNTNPLLGPLANNGGLTPTHLPLCNSPAIDAVPLAASSDVAGTTVTTDQRGISRPQGAASDIGSVEAGATVTVTILSTTGPWSQSLNPTFDYGFHDNTPPVVIDDASGVAFTPGSTLTVTYLSGTVQAGAGYPFNDANGLPGFVRNYCENFGCFPAFFMNPRPDLLSMALVGAFTNNGVILGNPFPIGNGPKTLTVPAGANQLSLGINDTRFSDNSGFFTVSVSGGSVGVAPTITSQPVSLTKCAGQSATFAVAATGNGLTYQWRKNGTPISGATGNTFSIAAVNSGDAGSYDVVVTGACGSVNSNTATLSVNLPPTANAGGPYSVNEGSAVTVTAFGVDPESGPLSFAWDLDNNGSFETPGQNVAFSAAALDGPSSRTIKVRVTDNCGLPTIAQAVVNIQNVAPTVGAITASLDPIPVNTTITPNASFTDPGTPDTHTAVWNWDDPANPSSAGAVTETNGSGSASGSHSFTAAGVYEIKLTVTDDDGGAGQSIFQFVVVYDPNDGFVTGGGWIDSPAGAYGPDPILIGKANFGFVSKYQKGANVPTGNTEFQFKAGNFNFHSTVYEWLVVAGAKAQYKGSGKVNGAGDYGFMLTATDGQLNGGGGVDKFRIKIWDKASGVVIYDNKRGDSDDLDNASPQALGGGSIVIHQ